MRKFIAALLFAGLLTFVGCGEKTAGEQLDDKTEDVKDAAEDAKEATEEAAEDVKKDLKKLAE